MQIVIELDEDIAQRIIDGKKDEPMNIVQAYPATIAHAIKEGVSLIKGHGRLIDADELDITTITTDDYSGNEVLDVVLKEDVDNASTIVEADKE